MNFSDHFQSYLAHVDEFRTRLIRVVVVFFIAALFFYNFVGYLLPVLVAPAGKLVFTSPAEAFSAYITLAAVGGFLVSLPWTLYEIWSFVGVALRPEERKRVAVYGPLSLFFFVLGVGFSYFVAVPLTYGFLMKFGSDQIQPMITVGSYMGFLANMLIAFGMAFELPLVLGFLASVGIVSGQFLRQKRRHAIIIILIVAAFLTPPDVISQLALALPLMVLYELGIIFAGFSGLKKI